MENSSVANLRESFVQSLPSNFRYLLREESAATPVYAVNEAFTLCRAPLVCLMIDGARMVSPGIIQNALMAYAITPGAIVAVPGYHLGNDEQHMVDGVEDQLAFETTVTGVGKLGGRWLRAVSYFDFQWCQPSWLFAANYGM